MDSNNKKFNNPVDISELIDTAVNNAVVRRNQAIELEDELLDVSAEEANNVTGGAVISKTPIIAGMIICPWPPITMGLIAVDPVFKA